jgi:hypothetical protein
MTNEKQKKPAASQNSDELSEDELKGVDGGTSLPADSFSFGVEREMKESGEKGGTADLSIGVGELQPVAATPKLRRR